MNFEMLMPFLSMLFGGGMQGAPVMGGMQSGFGGGQQMQGSPVLGGLFQGNLGSGRQMTPGPIMAGGELGMHVGENPGKLPKGDYRDSLGNIQNNSWGKDMNPMALQHILGLFGNMGGTQQGFYNKKMF